MRILIASNAVEGFAGEVTWAQGELHIALSGSADHASDQTLRALLRDAHAAAKQLGAQRAIVDVRKLRFMNSSCIAAMLGWTSAIASEPSSRRYPIQVLWDPANGWERRSMDAIVRVCSVPLTLDPPLRSRTATQPGVA